VYSRVPDCIFFQCTFWVVSWKFRSMLNANLANIRYKLYCHCTWYLTIKVPPLPSLLFWEIIFQRTHFTTIDNFIRNTWVYCGHNIQPEIPQNFPINRKTSTRVDRDQKTSDTCVIATPDATHRATHAARASKTAASYNNKCNIIIHTTISIQCHYIVETTDIRPVKGRPFFFRSCCL